jgi:hypothetical protein
VLRCVVLYCVVLCCVVLCCVVLCCVVLVLVLVLALVLVLVSRCVLWVVLCVGLCVCYVVLFCVVLFCAVLCCLAPEEVVNKTFRISCRRGHEIKIGEHPSAPDRRLKGKRVENMRYPILGRGGGGCRSEFIFKGQGPNPKLGDGHYQTSKSSFGNDLG